MTKKRRTGRRKPPRNVPAYKVTPRRAPLHTSWLSDSDGTATLTRGTPGPHREAIEAALKALLNAYPACPACGSGWMLEVQGPETLTGPGGVAQDMAFVDVLCVAEFEFGLTAADEEFLHEDTNATYAVYSDGTVGKVLEADE